MEDKKFCRICKKENETKFKSCFECRLKDRLRKESKKEENKLKRINNLEKYEQSLERMRKYNKKNSVKQCNYVKSWRKNNCFKTLLYGLKSKGEINYNDQKYIDENYLLDLYKTNNKKCVSCDVVLNIDDRRKPTGLKLNKIDNSKGYIKNNIKLICRCCFKLQKKI